MQINSNSSNAGLRMTPQRNSSFTSLFGRPNLNWNRKVSPEIAMMNIEDDNDDIMNDKNFSSIVADMNVEGLAANSSNSARILTEITPKALPMFYVLEKKYSRKFDPLVTPVDMLIKRLKGCLESLSIQIDGIEDGNRLHLLTVELIPMVVCFWDKREISKESNRKDKVIVVEIQSKTTSMTFEYMKYSAKIFKHLETEQRNNSGEQLNSNIRKDQLDATALPAVESEQWELHKIETLVREKRQKNLYQEAMDMLELGKLFLSNDSTIQTGLETFFIMTDPNKVGIQVSLFSSRIILGSELGMDDLSKTLQCLAFGRRTSKDLVVDAFDGYCPNDRMQYLALNVILSAIKVVMLFNDYDQGNMNNNNKKRNEILISFLKNARIAHQMHTVERLIEILQTCNSTDESFSHSMNYNLHSAYVAVQILYYLCICCDAVCGELIMYRTKTANVDSTIQTILQDVYEISTLRSHYLLQAECNRLWSLLLHHDQNISERTL